MAKPIPYGTQALRKWRKAEWIEGDGPFALLAHCDVLTISLHMTIESALKSKKFIDETGCGHACTGNHEIINLEEI